MKRTFSLIITFLFVFCSSAKSQDVDVCGLVLGEVYSKTQVVAVLGEPSTTVPPSIGFSAWCSSCKFGENELVFQAEDGNLTDFSVVDSKYKVLTNLPNGGLKVGDKFTNETLEMVKKYLGTWKINTFKAYSNVYYFEVEEYAYFWIRLDTNGQIKSFSAEARD